MAEIAQKGLDSGRIRPDDPPDMRMDQSKKGPWYMAGSMGAVAVSTTRAQAF